MTWSMLQFCSCFCQTTNALAVFQSFINDFRCDMLDKLVFVYLDNILIFSADEQTHIWHMTYVRQVLQRLLDNQLFVSGDSIQMDPVMVRAVVDWPTPTSRKLVKHFLGFANFYRWLIRNFSTIAAPLHALTSPQVQFQWSPPYIPCLLEAKRESFTSAPVVNLWWRGML